MFLAKGGLPKTSLAQLGVRLKIHELKVRLSENVFMKSSFGQNTNENISEISVLYCL